VPAANAIAVAVQGQEADWAGRTAVIAAPDILSLRERTFTPRILPSEKKFCIRNYIV
jgi:hypothetical protein